MKLPSLILADDKSEINMLKFTFICYAYNPDKDINTQIHRMLLWYPLVNTDMAQ